LESFERDERAENFEDFEELTPGLAGGACLGTCDARYCRGVNVAGRAREQKAKLGRG
jgi:hypothetical protein